MGHDTRAYLGRAAPSEPHKAASSTVLTEEIAYLPGNYWQYEALGAEEYDGRVSGIGIGRWFTRDQITSGLERLRSKELVLAPVGRSCKPAITFFEKCLDHMPIDQTWVYIDFG